MPQTNADQLALCAGLTAKTNQLCLGLESGAADILELVSPTTAELVLLVGALVLSLLGLALGIAWGGAWYAFVHAQLLLDAVNPTWAMLLVFGLASGVHHWAASARSAALSSPTWRALPPCWRPATRPR